ncbi:deaminase [Campylobacter curvus]|uniref:deaminase n=1 Tax=Campylobacter curvus TaxID=200 RepID=UPI00146FFFB6|nr:deaminase [Campylobacter curvus]
MLSNDILISLVRAERLSIDTRQIGCVAFNTKGDILIGRNHSIFEELPMRRADNSTQAYVVHAEEECLLQCKEQETYTLVISYAPCEHCAALIIKSLKIKQVIYVDILPKHKNGINLLLDAGISVRRMDATERDSLEVKRLLQTK